MRHLTRHAHQTLCATVKTALIATGWIPTAPVTTAIFGATPVTFMEIDPQTAGLKIALNTVAVTLGPRNATEEAELGGLVSTSYILFVDVYGEAWSVTAALVDDIIEAIQYLRTPVLDYTSGTGVESTYYIELDEMQEDEPPAAGSGDRRYWRVVSGVVTVFYLD